MTDHAIIGVFFWVVGAFTGYNIGKTVGVMDKIKMLRDLREPLDHARKPQIELTSDHHEEEWEK